MSERVPIELAAERAFAEVLAPRAGDAALLDALVGSAASQVAATTGTTHALGTAKGLVVALAVGLGSIAAWGLGRGDPETLQVEPPARDASPVAVAPAVVAVPVEREIAVVPVSDSAPAVHVEERVAPSPTSRPRRRATPVAVDPDELLRRANAARRQGAFDEADHLYDELERSHPQSRAAQVARVSHGRLLLGELRRADDALDRFTGYLERDPDGRLAEEARVGRARALAALGRDADARAAWADLLARHPGSIHADTARRMLDR